MKTILNDEGVVTVNTTVGLWLDAADAERVTGWTLKPEGMCRNERCVPLPGNAVSGGKVDVEAFWRRLGAPIVHDEAKEVWVLGESAHDRNEALAGSAAPDFTLPDLSGKPHTLSSLRGRKVFLTTWASW